MVAPLLVVNGPIRKQIGMNAGHNCFGSGNRANATIGRAIRMVLLNVGGGWPGDLDKATLGHPGKYRSEEHTSELQSLMRISYAVFCLNKKNRKQQKKKHQRNHQPRNQTQHYK